MHWTDIPAPLQAVHTLNSATKFRVFHFLILPPPTCVQDLAQAYVSTSAISHDFCQLSTANADLGSTFLKLHYYLIFMWQ